MADIDDKRDDPRPDIQQAVEARSDNHVIALVQHL